MKNVIESLKHMAFFIGGMQGIFYSWQTLKDGGIMQIGLE